jgi:hypothetical protein
MVMCQGNSHGLLALSGVRLLRLTLSEIEPTRNVDDQQWSSTIGYVDQKCFLRVDDDDVSATVTAHFLAVERLARH